MRVAPYVAALALVTLVSACSDWGDDWFKHLPDPSDHPFAAGQDQPEHCAPADTTCGMGIHNSSVPAPAPMQKGEVNAPP